MNGVEGAAANGQVAAEPTTLEVEMDMS